MSDDKIMDWIKTDPTARNAYIRGYYGFTIKTAIEHINAGVDPQIIKNHLQRALDAIQETFNE